MLSKRNIVEDPVIAKDVLFWKERKAREPGCECYITQQI